MWINKPHYFMPGLDYYNFPYAFGNLFAIGLAGCTGKTRLASPKNTMPCSH